MLVQMSQRVVKLGLGTVQFGLAYGVTNARGRVPESDAAAIVETAVAAGVDLFDTAAAYGDSESVLGRILPSGAMRVVSKLSAIHADTIGEDVIARCRASVARSLAESRRSQLYGLLLHRPDDLRKPGRNRLIALLAELKAQGLVAKVGVSAYERGQIETALDLLPVDLVQVPFNLADQRLLRDGTLARLKQRNVEVHARSAFLQGALLAEPAALPPHFVPHRDRLTRLGELAGRNGLSRLALCLRFVLERPEIDAAIVGVTAPPELDQILAAARDETPLPAGLDSLATDDPRLINPSLWPPR